MSEPKTLGEEMITEADATTLRDILKAWEVISSAKSLEEIYANATDHRHDLFAEGEVLLDKMTKLAKSQTH